MSTPGQPEEAPHEVGALAPDPFGETMARPTPSNPTVSLEKKPTTGESRTTAYEVPGTPYQELQNPGPQNPGPQNPGPQNPGSQNPGSQNPGSQNPGSQNPGHQNTGHQNTGSQYAATQVGPSPYSNIQYANTQSANTQSANTQYSSGEYPGGPPSGGYPGYQYPQRTSGGGGRAVLLGIAIACVIGLAVAAVFVWLKVVDSDDDSSTTARPGVTTEQQQQQQTETVTATPVDPEVAAGESLRNQAATDASDMRSSHNNQWAAQVSSKRLGLVAEGTTWTNEAIWSEFESSRSRYPQVKLLNSSEWPVFSEQGWWVTVSAQNFSSPEAALSWCRSVSLDKDHCFAKLVSDTRGPEGTTLYQR